MFSIYGKSYKILNSRKYEYFVKIIIIEKSIEQLKIIHYTRKTTKEEKLRLNKLVGTITKVPRAQHGKNVTFRV